MKKSLKVLTLNCWGLPFITPQKNKRLDAIIEILKGGAWDIVALQEVWLRSDQNRIVAKSGFPHHKIFRESGRWISSGMLILSKHPIIKTDFHPFRVTGFPHKFNEGDFHAHKGVGFALIETPSGEIPFFCAHLIAKYSKRQEQDPNRVFRIAQVMESISFIRKTVPDRGFILAGDLNAENHDLEIEAICGLSGISQQRSHRIRSDQKKLDHILCGASQGSRDFAVVGEALVFRKKRRFELRFSDHYGVSASIRWQKTPADRREYQKVLGRILRYLRYSMAVVRDIDRFLGWIPLLGMIVRYFMSPQMLYIEALVNTVEADIRSEISSKKVS